MRVFEWNLDDSFKFLYVCNKRDADKILTRNLEVLDTRKFSVDNDYYFLANESLEIVSPLPSLSYAFKDMEHPPYGKELNPYPQLDKFTVLPFEKVQLVKNRKMLGGIIGDIAGSRYEYMNVQHKLHPADLIDRFSTITDETILYTAVANGLEQGLAKVSSKWMEDKSETSMLKGYVKAALLYFGDIYKNIGFEDHFYRFILSRNPKPYDINTSDGAARGAFAGWIANSLEEAQVLGALQASVTHSNLDVQKAAGIFAGSIYLLRTTGSKEQLKKYVSRHYTLGFSLKNVSMANQFDSRVQNVLPLAIKAFLESDNYAECICKAIEIGGDSDTIAFMAGALAETIYNIPLYLRKKASRRIPDYLAKTLYTTINNMNFDLA